MGEPAPTPRRGIRLVPVLLAVIAILLATGVGLFGYSVYKAQQAAKAIKQKGTELLIEAKDELAKHPEVVDEAKQKAQVAARITKQKGARMIETAKGELDRHPQVKEAARRTAYEAAKALADKLKPGSTASTTTAPATQADDVTHFPE